VSLSFPVIRILSKDYDFDLVKRGQIESIEYIRSLGIDDMSGLFFLEKKFLDMSEIRLSEFFCKNGFP